MKTLIIVFIFLAIAGMVIGATPSNGVFACEMDVFLINNTAIYTISARNDGSGSDTIECHYNFDNPILKYTVISQNCVDCMKPSLTNGHLSIDCTKNSNDCRSVVMLVVKG